MSQHGSGVTEGTATSRKPVLQHQPKELIGEKNLHSHQSKKKSKSKWNKDSTCPIKEKGLRVYKDLKAEQCT